ncbi:MAG: hydrogenase 2 operon protein HybA [Nitrospirae bacterium]|nr:hydrogenase 2 operon protein HybA [Nitrospirota bacterium]
MDIKRRDFLKVVAGGGLLLATGEPAFARAPKTLPPNALGILYDATICIGCKACQSACKQYNNMPPDHTYRPPELTDQIWDNPVDLSAKTLNIIKAYKSGTGATKNREVDGFSFIKRHCMHCIDPACVSACPVSALQKNPDNGIVSYNKNACIGCRYCQIACPFNIPKFEFDKPFPQIRKCQLCSHRIEKGEISACCEFCPTGASIFGKVTDLIEEAKRRLQLKPCTYYKYPVSTVTSSYKLLQPVDKYQEHIYGEKEGGGTQYILLAGVPFDKLGLPVLPELSDANRSETIQHTIYYGLIAPVMFLAGLLYAVHRNAKNEDDNN